MRKIKEMGDSEIELHLTDDLMLIESIVYKERKRIAEAYLEMTDRAFHIWLNSFYDYLLLEKFFIVRDGFSMYAAELYREAVLRALSEWLCKSWTISPLSDDVSVGTIKQKINFFLNVDCFFDRKSESFALNLPRNIRDLKDIENFEIKQKGE